MLSTKSSIILLSLICVLTIESKTTQSCEGQVDKLDSCMAVVQFPGDCDSAIVNLTNSDYAKCNSSNFFWSYPLHNLTLVIETPFTTQHQQYAIYLDNKQAMSGVSHIYRIINKQEQDVTSKDETLIQYSDSNYKIILKFQGPNRLQRYGVNLQYNATAL